VHLRHVALLVRDIRTARRLYEREADRVPIVEEVDEPDQLSFKCVDPDGCIVEVYTSIGA
jgi:hypothetical protein